MQGSSRATSSPEPDRRPRLVLSGDFEQFAIVDRLETSIEIVPVLLGSAHRPTGQQGFLMHYRSGSDVPIPDAFRLSNFST